VRERVFELVWEGVWVGARLPAPAPVSPPPPPPRERPGTLCLKGWVGPGVSLEGCSKFHPPPQLPGTRSPDRSVTVARRL